MTKTTPDYYIGATEGMMVAIDECAAARHRPEPVGDADALRLETVALGAAARKLAREKDPAEPRSVRQGRSKGDNGQAARARSRTITPAIRSSAASPASPRVVVVGIG